MFFGGEFLFFRSTPFFYPPPPAVAFDPTRVQDYRAEVSVKGHMMAVSKWLGFLIEKFFNLK